MNELWFTLEHWLSQHFPEVLADLNPGCSDEELDELERWLNCSLPEDFRAFYKRHNGQIGEAPGLFLGLPFLSTDALYGEWCTWQGLAEDFAKEAEDFNEESRATKITGESYPHDAIKPIYINLRWIPFSHDGSGNHLGIDLDPGVAGVRGQVINFGPDENNKFVIASSLTDFVTWIITQYQMENYQKSEHSLNLKEPPNTHFLDAVPSLFGRSRGSLL
ncbi:MULTISPECIES: SMI1/KNR4 family protein [unclassified Leptolyngbya]|uniref:SMI1/KNR4 family protein n=1 Tax=unclassified Leptolyngbya TaxID=2650499 RepID=UPI001689A956|nr:MULTISPECIES: SMI1/KNR4 family protein [unclassified Leptolyngbya]MBD1909243.1 SMI1/KNR4 family protein [Leptolyngbya sp. FACHB-8]MBD2156991.1 SMI1/KNR4 family protein [Leptolyngbya sp. FACHB-16]